MTQPRRRNLVKTVPGLLISAFFLWYTFRGISFEQILALRFVYPVMDSRRARLSRSPAIPFAAFAGPE